MKRLSRVAVLVGVLGSGLWLAGVAGALNPQPLPPKVLGVVRDACTRLPVAGATLTLASETPGERDPGPIQTGPLGGFLVSALAPGTYSLSVAAPGYDPFPDPAAAPTGVPTAGELTADPAPGELAPGEAVNKTIVASVLLAPSNPGADCSRDPGPINAPALTGLVRNGRTGLPILRGNVTLRPTSGERDPGPMQFGFLGVFGWRSLEPGSYALSVSAPGFRGFGGPAGTGPASPAIPVTVNPGPMQFPDGASLSVGKTLDIRLARSG